MNTKITKQGIMSTDIFIEDGNTFKEYKYLNQNLLPQNYSDYSSSIWSYSLYVPNGTSTIKPIKQDNGDILLTGPGTGGSDQCYLANGSHLLDMKENTEYTLSIQIKPQGVGNFRFYWYDFDANGRIWSGSKNFALVANSEEQIVSWTRTTSPNTTRCYWELNMISSANSSTILLRANSLKLEKGPIATPWTIPQISEGPAVIDTMFYEL